MFDSLALARALTKAGIESEHAEAIAAGMQQAAEHGDHVTRSDFHTAIDSINSKVGTVIDRMTGKIGTVIDRMTGKIGTVIDRMTGKIGTVIDRMTDKVSAELDGVGTAVDTAVDILKAELRADVAAREARIYRFLLMQAVAIIGVTVAILKFLD